MSEPSQWKPDMDAAVRQLIRTTLSASGHINPDELPHLIRNQVSAQVKGDIDIDDYIKSVLKKMKEAGEI